jgi:hypothetical protein
VLEGESVEEGRRGEGIEDEMDGKRRGQKVVTAATYWLYRRGTEN